MDFIRNASVKQKFLILLFIPMLALLYFKATALSRQMDYATSMEHIVELTELSAINSALAHELQKERGMSAGFIGSQGSKFSTELPNQRRLSDQRLAQWQQWVSDNDYQLYDQVAGKIAGVQSSIRQLASIRSQVSALELSLADMLGFYTGNITQLLSVPALATQYTEDGDLSRLLQAYYNFLQGKERAGIERAVLSNAFGQDAFGPGLFTRFVALVSGQDAFFSNYQLFADPDGRSTYNRFTSGSEEQEVQRYRSLAISKAYEGGFGIEASAWFAASTARINALKQLEEAFKSDMIGTARQAAKSADRKMWVSLFSGLIIIGMTALIAWWISSLMYRQIDRLAACMDEAGNEYRLDTRCDVLMKDELGKTANTFNEMMGNISTLVKDIDVTSHQLELISIQNHCTVSLSAKGMSSQQDETTKVVVGVSQLEEATREIASSIQAVADQSDDANQVAEHSGAVVEQSVEKISNLNQHMGEVSGVIRELHESSGAIGGVLNVIKSIAEQTNLLALNAAIEAARAGEQGRGFAVVADEVRTLAQRTQESTAEIEKIVGKFQSESEAAFKAVEESQSAVDESVTMAGELDQALVAIRQSVRDIQSLSDQVASAAEEQVSTNQELSNSMKNIHDIATHTVATSEFMRKTSQEQRSLSQELNQKADRFTVKAD